MIKSKMESDSSKSFKSIMNDLQTLSEYIKRLEKSECECKQQLYEKECLIANHVTEINNQQIRIEGYKKRIHEVEEQRFSVCKKTKPRMNKIDNFFSKRKKDKKKL